MKFELIPDLMPADTAAQLVSSRLGIRIVVLLAMLTVPVFIWGLVSMPSENAASDASRYCHYAIAQQDYRAASVSCRTAAHDVDPSSGEYAGLLGYRAYALYQLGAYAAAISVWSDVIEIHPDNLEARHNRAVAYYMNGDMATAFKEAEANFAAASTTVAIHRFYASLLYEAGEVDRSLAVINAGLSKFPNDPDLVFDRQTTYRNAGRYREAITDLDNLIAAYPDDPGFRRERADTFTALGDYNAALADIDKILGRTPGDYQHLVQRAYIMMKAGDADAIAGYVALAKVPPIYEAFAQYLSGRILLEKGDPGGALVHFDRSLARDPELAESHAGRALAILTSRDRTGAEQRQQAKADLAMAMSLPSRTIDLPALACMGYTALDELNAAQVPCSQAVSSNPQYGDAWRGMAYFGLRSGTFDIGLQDADRAVRLSPRDALSLLIRAQLHAELGASEEAARDRAAARSLAENIDRIAGQWQLDMAAPQIDGAP